MTKADRANPELSPADSTKIVRYTATALLNAGCAFGGPPLSHTKDSRFDWSLGMDTEIMLYNSLSRLS